MKTAQKRHDMANNGFGKVTDPSVGKATQFPHNDPTKGGRPKTKAIKELLIEADQNDNKIRFPISQCEIHDDYVEVEATPRTEIALNLLKMAKEDVQWLRELLKIMGEYAPEKKEHSMKGVSVKSFLGQFKTGSVD